LRESPALDVINLLIIKGSKVSYYDPYIPSIQNCACGRTLRSEKSLAGLRKYDAVAVITDHTDVDYKKVLKEANIIVDSRNAFKNSKSNKIVRI